MTSEEGEQDMSAGREHAERRLAQQRAADKRRVKRVEDIDWRKDQTNNN